MWEMIVSIANMAVTDINLAPNTLQSSLWPKDTLHNYNKLSFNIVKMIIEYNICYNYYNTMLYSTYES